MESLDASYALLSDVSARNRALQARLRGSLPLLWTDNALVMTSAAPRRRRGRLQPEQSAVAGEADQMLLALEEQAGLQVSRRYKRRVEWEVARRIARVDRELQQYPPAQRFWNQKRKKETPAQPRLYRQRLNGVERAQDDANARDSLTVRHGKVAGERRDDVKITAKKYSSDKAANEPKTWVKPSVLTESSSNEKKAVKHVATSPLPVARENAGDQENVAPNAVTAAEFETSDVTNEEPLWGDSGTKQSVDRKLLDDFHLGEVENNRDAGEGVADSEQTTDGVSSRLAEAKTSTPAQAHSTPSEDVVFNPQKDPLASVQHASDDDIASVIDEPVSRRTKPQTEDRPSSSIGRQVLSDFRTMPSVPSFGAQPILPADGFSKTVNTRLNADVLRRLFSDLDTDKDGHVNRIETCMALHRLQISVSTQKIISFFHHIHSSTDGKAERNRNAQHVPMKEVINYKEFVAFVTAAYDKQQQQKAQRSKSSVRRNAWKEGHDRALPLSVPSTSLPIYSHPARSPQAKSTSAPQLKEQEIRVYELNDAEFEQDELSFEERVIKEIPDFLVSKILAGTANSINKVANEAAASIVRKSLESLIGKNSVDDHIVNEITQELLRERLRKLEVSSQDDERDVTGLTQAAAYYNAYKVHDDVESSSGSGDLGSEDLVNWIDILTEEQVSGLVQQIWKDKQASLLHPPIGVVDDTNVGNAPTNTPEDRSVRRIDEATDTTELEISTVTIVSEKAVQVSDTDCQGETTASSSIPEEERGGYAVSSTATPSRPIYLPRTQFARALGTSPDDFRELFNSVTSIQVLQELRQQRRMHQDLQNGQKTTNACEKTNTQKRGNDINVPLMQNTLLSLEDDSDSSDMIDQAPQDEHDSLPLPPTESVLLTEKTLDMNESDVSSHESVLGGSSSMSSSAISSISGHLHGVYRGIDNLQLYERPIKRRRPRERRRPLSVSGSSVPDSLCSAELSEGEISREESSELSDGEIYGDSKRSYINNKNKTPRAIETTDGDDLLHSSVESGELTPMMRIHGGFRRQLLARSISSSVESGEVEDGTIPS